MCWGLINKNSGILSSKVNGLPLRSEYSNQNSELSIDMAQYSLGEAIQQFLKQSRMKGEIQALQIEELWEKLMGKTIAKYTDQIRIANKTLFITTHVAPLKQELTYQKETIKLRVNEALGSNDIQEVVIQ